MVTSKPPPVTTPAVTRAGLRYPESDGQPMGETGFHVSAIMYLCQALRRFLRGQRDIYVGADMFVYYEEGNPEAVCAPDVFVARGVGSHERRTYLLWEEGAAPCVVFEVTSASTRLEDVGTKRAVYEMLGVPEYYLFDPLGEYLEPRLQGFELVDENYRPLVAEVDGTLTSSQLGVRLRPEGALLRVVDPTTGAALPTGAEALERAEAAAERAEAAAQRAQAEAKRAQSEAQRAAAAEAEVARLRAELERLRQEQAGD